MSHSTIALRRLCLRPFAIPRTCAHRAGLPRVNGQLVQRHLSSSASLNDIPNAAEPKAHAKEEQFVPLIQKTEERRRNRSSLHVAGIHPDTTDQEFRDAFSMLPGIVDIQLVFNSGALRDYKNTTNRGFGFLHFENEAAAKAAVDHMRKAPVKIHGYRVEVHEFKAAIPPPNEPTHVIHIHGVPLDLQYLEVMGLLKEKCPYFKSIRFLCGQPGVFLGVAGVAFSDTRSAIKAKEALVGSRLGGVLIREHKIVFGRPMFETRTGPTNTLMILGTPKDKDKTVPLRKQLETYSFVERFKFIKDEDTREYRGTVIVACKTITNAWELAMILNREYPHCRVIFLGPANKAQREKRATMAQSQRKPGPRLRPRAELDE